MKGNKNYRSGRAREYKIKRYLESQGMKVTRAAGSHSEFDLIAFDPSTSILNLIQVKPRSMSIKAKARLQSKISWAERIWQGRVHVVSMPAEVRR